MKQLTRINFQFTDRSIFQALERVINPEWGRCGDMSWYQVNSVGVTWITRFENGLVSSRLFLVCLFPIPSLSLSGLEMEEKESDSSSHPNFKTVRNASASGRCAIVRVWRWMVTGRCDAPTKKLKERGHSNWVDSINSNRGICCQTARNVFTTEWISGLLEIWITPGKRYGEIDRVDVCTM